MKRLCATGLILLALSGCGVDGAPQPPGGVTLSWEVQTGVFFGN
jgi:hypothetical protein